MTGKNKKASARAKLRKNRREPATGCMDCDISRLVSTYRVDEVSRSLAEGSLTIDSDSIAEAMLKKWKNFFN